MRGTQKEMENDKDRIKKHKEIGRDREGKREI